MPTRTTLTGLAVSLALLPVLAGCSSSDSGSTASTTVAPPGGSSVPAATAPATAPGTTVAAGCENELELVNARAATETTLADRAVEVDTAWADDGPHPANTVDTDSELEAAIAEFPIPVSEQFGYSIPVGAPDAPDGKLYLTFRLQLPDDETIEAGQTFTTSSSGADTAAADGEVSFYALYAGSTRLLPGDATITVTSITDEQVCGTIESVTKTDLQTFVGIDGTFALDRIQALEAEAEAGGSAAGSGTTGTTR